MRKWFSNVGAAGFAVLLVTSMLVGAVGAQQAGGVDWGADAAPNLEDSATITKPHNMSWGTSDEAARYVENDQGDRVKLERKVNDSVDNPFTYTATDVAAEDLGAFPHSKDGVSALDAGEWSKDMSGSAGTGSISNVETAPDVDAVALSTSGQSSSDVANFTFSNFSVTSDEAKRYLSLRLDVNSIDAGGTVEFRVVDESGDYKVAEINTSRSSGEDFVTNASGEGIFYQRQLGSMATNGAGSFSNVERVEIHVVDGDADVEIAGLNLESKSMYDLGTERRDTDGDDDLEDVEITEIKTGGPISIASLDSIGSAFESATINGLEIDMVATPALQGTEDLHAEFNETGDKYPGYHGTATMYVRFHPEDYYDVSISNAVLIDEQPVTNDRVLSVEYAEGVSEDTAFGDISDSAWSDKTSLYTGEGAEVTVDDTRQPGSYDVVKVTFKLTEDQFKELRAPTGGSGGGAKGGGGLGSLPIIGGLLVAVLGWIKGRGN